MKKLLSLILVCFSLHFAGIAQDDNKDKTRKTATPRQRVHNTFSKHKHYSGTVSKHKKGDNESKRKQTNTKDEIKND